MGDTHDIKRYKLFSSCCLLFIGFTAFLAVVSYNFGGVAYTGLISLLITLSICFFSMLYNSHLVSSVLSKPDGTEKMRAISDAIKKGSEGYLSVQYSAIAMIAVVTAIVLFIIYGVRGMSSKDDNTWTKAGAICLSFIMGCGASAFAGYTGVWASIRVNVRVAEAARLHNYEDALLISFIGGAISSILSSTLCIIGISFLYVLFSLILQDDAKGEQIAVLLGGYGFGASFVALFMQLGGGIYTKAADVGADMVGKIEQNIPEDDPRNPAVIADLVGDNVGDCAGSMADVFESIAGELIGTMILGASLAKKIKDSGSAVDVKADNLIFFSLMIHALNLVVSIAGIMSVRPKSDEEPLVTMKKGFMVSIVAAIFGLGVVCYMMLSFKGGEEVWKNFFGCGIVGLVVSYLLVLSTQYYTDYDYYPVKKIFDASSTGHGTNVIAGVSVGMESTAFPALIISIGLYVSYSLGKNAGLVGDNASPDAIHASGLFGTAVATMGMLSLSTFILSMNNFGPIADNAGGIVEMSDQPESVRVITDKLDAVGNVTKAATKGYAVGGSALACFLLFAAFLEEINEEIMTRGNKQMVKVISITRVEVMLGGLLGIAMIFSFVGFAIDSVGRTAQKVVLEVRRQFDAFPGIMDYSQKPDYKECVKIVTNAALYEMIKPAMVALVSPIVVGYVGKLISAKDENLGIEVLAAFLMFGTLTGLLMAIFLDNAGGAWDNAKKLCEKRNQKGTLRHHATITGDTVGDPFKDTAGPALHVIITTMSTTALVLGPLFITSK